MLLFTRYTPDEMALMYVLGFISAIVLICVIGWIVNKADEWKEFKDFKKNKQPTDEVVDAHFVVRPHTQLNTSQALVRRTSLTTNRDKRIDRR